MKQYTLEEAFTELISTKGIHKKLSIDASSVRQMRFQLKRGREISSRKMQSLLQEAGWKITSELRFNKPKD